MTKSAQQTMIYFSLENSLLNFVLFNIALEVLLMSGFLLPHTANIQILEKRADSKPLCINCQDLWISISNFQVLWEIHLENFRGCIMIISKFLYSITRGGTFGSASFAYLKPFSGTEMRQTSSVAQIFRKDSSLLADIRSV